MAIDFASMLLQPSKTSAWDLSSGPGSLERQRLALAREQFEEAKRQNEREREWAKTEEAGRNARAAMEQREKLRAEEAARQAKLLEQQQGAQQKFGELAGTGKVQQAQAMLPYLEQLGIDVSTLGSVGGLPVFQMQNRAEEAAKAGEEFERGPRAIDGWDGEESATQSLVRMDGLGYPTNERGTLDGASPPRETAARGELGFEPAGALDAATTDALTPGEPDFATAAEFGGDEAATVSVGRGMTPGSLSTGDAYAQALSASQYARETRAPRRGPDEEDWQGAVPRNVIDLPAMAAETNARLSPMLKSIAGSLPSELQPGAEATARATAGLGLEAGDALGAFDKAIGPAVDIYKGQQNILAQKEKDNRLSRMDKSALQARGATKLEDLYKERGIDKSLNSVNKAAEVSRVLDNDILEDDGMVANAVMEAQNLKGAPSNTDLEFAFNIPKGSLITKGIAIIEEAVRGGMSQAQKAAVKSYMKAVEETQQRNLTDYLDNAFDTIDNDRSLDPEELAGFKSRLERSVPASVYNRYWEEREKSEKGSGARRGRSGRGSSVEQSAPLDAGELDADKLGRVIGHESQGDPTATSSAGASGTMQIMPDNLRAMGIEPEDFKKLSPAEQMPYNIRYLAGHGITKDSSAEDYAMAVAAPAFIGKPADTVVYPKSDDPKSAWAQNPGWRPAGGGDITVGSILKFYGLGGGKTAEAAPTKTEAKAAGALPEPKTAAEKRYLELLKKRGG